MRTQIIIKSGFLGENRGFLRNNPRKLTFFGIYLEISRKKRIFAPKVENKT